MLERNLLRFPLKDKTSKKISIRFLWLLVVFIPISTVMSTPDPGAQLRRQQEQEEQLRRQHTPQTDVRLQAPLDGKNLVQRLPSQETPCFQIDKLTIQVLDAEGQVTQQHPFIWAEKAANYTNTQEPDTVIGHCLGSAGINLVMKRLQNAIISRGYITTRVLAEPQDLKTGELILTVIPGRIGDVRFKMPLKKAMLWNALPALTGRILNLRDIEQGLENLKRVPTVEADISGAGYPDFTPYAIKKVKVNLTGIREKGFKLANQAVGLEETPNGYTWHHHQESGLMQLIPSDLHYAVRHTGGAATSGIKPYK